jgi:hypothetical protein
MGLGVFSRNIAIGVNLPQMVLGGAYHELDDQAFAHYREGNRLKQARFVPAIFTGEVDELIEFFSAETIGALSRSPVTSAKPVFVVGMPRSGSTLVEQILSSHPRIAGAGELGDISNLVMRLQRHAGKAAWPACGELSRQYLDRLDEAGPNAERVIDKALLNFLHLGLIQMLFPAARVIHCTRDPLDTCLSCYFHDFTGTHHYSYDLDTLGRFYRQYQRLMAHWSAVLSLPIKQVSYEALVADPDTQSRALVDFCGLKWDERCSRFYDNRRSVVTSSASQVRQPVYRRSVNRHRHYDNYLEPLKRALQIPD